MNPTTIHNDVGLLPDLTQWVGDPALLWLWRKLVATAPIRPLAWESHILQVQPERKREKERWREGGIEEERSQQVRDLGTQGPLFLC